MSKTTGSQAVQKGFLDDLAANLDSLGLSRISGLIIGCFIVSEKEDLEFDELVEKLNVSKASVSNNLRTLEKIGFISRHRKTGQRKSIYRLGGLDMKEIMLERMKSIESFTSIMKKGRELSPKSNENAERFLNGIIHFYDWVLKEFPDLLKDYQKPKN